MPGQPGQGDCVWRICSRSDLKDRTRACACARAVHCAISLSPLGLFKKPKPTGALSILRGREGKPRPSSKITAVSLEEGPCSGSKSRMSCCRPQCCELAALVQVWDPNSSLSREEVIHTQEGIRLRKGYSYPVQLQQMRPVILNSSFPFLPSFSPLVTEEGLTRFLLIESNLPGKKPH